MTKKIRIENADTSDHTVTIKVMQRGSNGAPDAIARIHRLTIPTQLIEEYVWKEQYIVIEEV